MEGFASNLVKKKIKKKHIKLKELYNRLSVTYYLPRIGSAACTLKTIEKLTLPESPYGALNLPVEATKGKLRCYNRYLLHEICSFVFTQATSKILFHEAVANRRYYEVMLATLDRDVFSALYKGEHERVEEFRLGLAYYNHPIRDRFGVKFKKTDFGGPFLANIKRGSKLLQDIIHRRYIRHTGTKKGRDIINSCKKVIAMYQRIVVRSRQEKAATIERVTKARQRIEDAVEKWPSVANTFTKLKNQMEPRATRPAKIEDFLEERQIMAKDEDIQEIIRRDELLEVRIMEQLRPHIHRENVAQMIIQLAKEKNPQAMLAHGWLAYRFIARSAEHMLPIDLNDLRGFSVRFCALLWSLSSHFQNQDVLKLLDLHRVSIFENPTIGNMLFVCALAESFLNLTTNGVSRDILPIEFASLKFFECYDTEKYASLQTKRCIADFGQKISDSHALVNSVANLLYKVYGYRYLKPLLDHLDCNNIDKEYLNLLLIALPKWDKLEVSHQSILECYKYIFAKSTFPHSIKQAVAATSEITDLNFFSRFLSRPASEQTAQKFQRYAAEKKVIDRWAKIVGSQLNLTKEVIVVFATHYPCEPVRSAFKRRTNAAKTNLELYITVVAYTLIVAEMHGGFAKLICKNIVKFFEASEPSGDVLSIMGALKTHLQEVMLRGVPVKVLFDYCQLIPTRVRHTTHQDKKADQRNNIYYLASEQKLTNLGAKRAHKLLFANDYKRAEKEFIEADQRRQQVRVTRADYEAEQIMANPRIWSPDELDDFNQIMAGFPVGEANPRA